MPNNNDNRSLWLSTAANAGCGPVLRDVEADVAIVGAGITGLTAALRLATAGKKVVVLEKGSVGTGESGRTTAHLTEAIDARYPALRNDFGAEGARLAAEGSREAIEFIAANVRALNIDCEFERVPGYLYTERAEDLDQLRKEAEEARNAGVDASFVDTVPLPFIVQGAVEYANQAQFHPQRYLIALAREIERLGGEIYSSTLVTEVHDGEPCTVLTETFTVRARDVVMAANTPSNDRVFIHTKVAAYRTYAFASRVPDDFIPRGLFWDTEDPYHYTRMQKIDGDSYIIIGGNDHKTGTKRDTEESYESLIQYGRNYFGVKDVDYRWSGQIMEPVDGLPFIGLNSLSRHVYISTGYAGQGMTFGTLGGIINSDLILGRESRYASLFDATRIKPLASAVDYITENIDFPKYFLAQHLTSFDVEGTDAAVLAPCEGKILQVDGRKVAAFRNVEGELHILSPVCPHLKCDVRFNDAERTWDCPCHGSRFSGEGELLNGPATHGLQRLDSGE